MLLCSRIPARVGTVAYWDFGPQDAPETLLLTHGEPSWSYLNRKLIGPLLGKGYRVVCFDQVGLGWSDKPAKREDVTYERSVAWNEDLLFNFLELRNITVVLQDWGGLIGLRVVARNPDKYARLVLSNTCLPTDDKGFQRSADGTDYIGAGFYKWKNWAHDGFIGHGKVGFILKKGSKGPSHGEAHEITEEEAAVYDLPFPTEDYMAAAHVFPELVPTPADDETGRHQPVGGEANRGTPCLALELQKTSRPADTTNPSHLSYSCVAHASRLRSVDSAVGRLREVDQAGAPRLLRRRLGARPLLQTLARQVSRRCQGQGPHTRGRCRPLQPGRRRPPAGGRHHRPDRGSAQCLSSRIRLLRA